MSKVVCLFQRRSSGSKGKMLHRGTYGMKKKAWEAMESEISKERLEMCELYDDVTEKRVGATQSRFNTHLTRAGRVMVLDEGGEAIFMFTEGETNVLRGWDIDEDGEPVYNPVKKAGESDG